MPRSRKESTTLALARFGAAATVSPEVRKAVESGNIQMAIKLAREKHPDLKLTRGARTILLRYAGKPGTLPEFAQRVVGKK